MNNKILIWSILLIFISCQSTQHFPRENAVQHLKADITYLASDELEGREVGTKGEKLAAMYIASQFHKMGLVPKGESESFDQLFQVRQRANPHSLEDSPEDLMIEGRNVLGFIDNKSPNTIVIGAHYDHLGFGGEGSLSPDSKDIHNGADDNASGVAAMIDLARRFVGKELANNLLFIAFSGEEKGLWGSNYFNKNPTIELNSVNYMINMDMVGRLNDRRQLAIYGVGTSPEWKPNLEAIKEPSFEFTFSESGVGPSDHTSFYLSDIPVLHFFTGQHKDYHKPGDDTHLINFEGLEDVVNFIEKLVLRLDGKEKLAFSKTADESSSVPRFEVTLGVVPDYLYGGEGMRIDGVREGKPAEKAGIHDGDVVIRMGEMEVLDMMGYMEALSKIKAGDTIVVTVKRDGKEVKKTVRF